MGNLVETAVFMQSLNDIQPLAYARWGNAKKGGEVDLVLLDRLQNPFDATEVKWSNRYVDHPGELTSLLAFAKKHNLTDVVVTTIDRREDRELQGIRIHFVPAAEYAYTQGRLTTLSHSMKASGIRFPDA